MLKRRRKSMSNMYFYLKSLCTKCLITGIEEKFCNLFGVSKKWKLSGLVLFWTHICYIHVWFVTNASILASYQYEDSWKQRNSLLFQFLIWFFPCIIIFVTFALLQKNIFNRDHSSFSITKDQAKIINQPRYH